MTAHHLVAPDLRDGLSLLPHVDQLTVDDLPQLRATLFAELPDEGVQNGVKLRHVVVPRPDGCTVPALLYTPEPNLVQNRAILNLHGGGFVAGVPQLDDRLMRRMASELGATVLAPAYRLAPEHRFPAALDDAYAALCWLADHTGAGPRDLIVRGASAGGGLGLTLALVARDRGNDGIGHLHLLYPMLDDRTTAHDHNGKAVWTAEASRFAWNSLLAGISAEATDLHPVPGRTDAVSRLPPVFMAVGSIDLFAGEVLALANKLIDAGNSLELHVYPGAYHGFDVMLESVSGSALERDAFEAMFQSFQT